MRHDPACPQGSRFTKWGPDMCVCHIIARTRAETNGVMNHDPLCEWSTPCTHGVTGQHERDTENLAVPDATYCWMCGADCHCKLLAKARAYERDKVAKRVAQHDVKPCDDYERSCACWHCEMHEHMAYVIAAARGEAS